MALIREIGIAVRIVIITLWLQSAGLAALIHWVRHDLASDAHRLGPFRSAVLVVRLTAAVIVLHGVLTPLIRSHSMIASSPSMAGKALLKTLASYCGNSKPVKLRYTSRPKGKSHRPQKDLVGNDAAVMQTEEQHGEGVALRFVEYGEEIGATHEQEGSYLADHLSRIVGSATRR